MRFRTLLDRIRRFWTCLFRGHDDKKHVCIDSMALMSGAAVYIFYGVKCVRCGRFEPLGHLSPFYLTPEEHARATLHGKFPERVLRAYLATRYKSA